MTDEIFGLKEHTLELEIQHYQQSLANKRSRNKRKRRKMVTEEDVKRIVKGPADLEERIEQLLKQKEILKSACRKAGHRIEELERDREIFKKELDRLSEENDNLRTMMKR